MTYDPSPFDDRFDSPDDSELIPLEGFDSSAKRAAKPAPIWNLPTERNPHFVGRGALLNDLHQRLSSGLPGARRQVILGAAGAGKTTLAIEYAHQHRAEYELAWWLSAEDASTIALGYAALARRLGMTFPDDTSLEDIRHVVRRVLSARESWLMIFDNAASPDEIRAFLPDTNSGHVVITSREGEWQTIGTQHVLGPLARAESIKFLRSRTGSKDPNDDARRLAQALGDLPLALEQAAALIIEARIGLTDYLRRFEKLWGELLEQSSANAHHGGDAVAMAMELSVRDLERAHPAAMELLSMAAFLGAEPIARGLLYNLADSAAEAAGDSTTDGPTLRVDGVDGAVYVLNSYSLASTRDGEVVVSRPTNAGALVVHRRVSELVRDRLPRDRQRYCVEGALRRVSRAFDFQSGDVSTWPACAQTLAPASAVATHAERLGVMLPETAELLDNIGRYLHRSAQFARAANVFARALALYERTLGPTHAKASTVCNNLGRALTRSASTARRRYFERAVSIDRVRYGDDDPHVATVVNNFGLCLHACGDLQTARAQFEWALDVFRQHYGVTHPKTASTLNNLGYTLAELGDLPAALESLTQALDVAQQSLTPNHPSIGSVLSNLGDVHRRTGQLDDALSSLMRALAIDEAAYGQTHPDVSRDHSRLGEVFEQMGDLEAARQHMFKALSIDEQVYGSEHVLLIHTLNPLARLLRAAGEVDESQKYLVRARQIYDHLREVVARGHS